MQIRAALTTQPGVPSLATLEMDDPRAEEVLVRIVATGICHTDLKSASAASPVPRPVVLGHEGAGIVERIGSAVTAVVPGDHVVLSFAYCGACTACRDSEPAYCTHQWKLNFGCTREEGAYLRCDGVDVHGDFFGQSSFATYAIAHQRHVVKVRPDAPLEKLGPLGCGVQTGAGAVLNEFRIRPGQSLAVFGVGTLGLSAVMAARLSGAHPIIAIDRHAHRLALARELGADLIFASSEAPLAPAIRDATRRRDGTEGVDYALDTTGVPEVMLTAIDVLAPRGTVGYVTSPWTGEPLAVPMRNMLLGRKLRGIIEGNSNPGAFIPLLVDLYMEGRFPFDRLLRFYQFDDIAQAFHDAESGDAIKPILLMAK
jgi:aryl-alcohol dehydrogenase